MNTIVFVLFAVIVLAIVVFVATRQKPEALPERREEPKLPEKEKAKPKPKVEAKPAAKPAAKESKPKAADTGAKAEPEQAAGEPEAKAQVEPSAPAAEAAPPAEEPIEEEVALDETIDVEVLRQGLAKSRETGGFFGRLRALFAGKKEIPQEIVESIEEVLLGSDVGVQTTQTLLSRIRDDLSKGDLVDTAKVWQALREEATRVLAAGGTPTRLTLRARPTVVLLVGVNGAGKTTTIGKLATRLKAAGKSCVLAAGDTFRAAAVQQLVVWGQRVGCEVVRGKDGADPSSVIFDAITKAEQQKADIVLADTAGRLHTKQNLMAEMTKIAKTAAKAMAGAPHEILLVIDATNGQNALTQAREFKEALDLTGIVLTKLDGTAKGGMVLGICDALKLPVRFVGLGERPDDLHDFVPEKFVEALLGKDSEANAA